MTRRNTIAMAGILSVASLVTPAFADQWNKRTILTVNEPIQIPGRVLQPGKYVMRLLESQSNRHIVQVFNETEQQLVTTILAIPNYRLQPTGETQFGFYETPAGQAKAMRSWFYPGDNFGQEFVYPKTESTTIAQYSNTNVPTTYAQTETELATARVATVDKAGTELELDRQTYMRADGQQPSTPAATQQMAQNTPQSVPAPAETTAAAPATPRALPETGSPAPLVGMLGFLSLGAAAILRRVNR